MVRKSLILIAAGLFLTMATAVWAQSGSIGSAHHSYRVVTVAEGLEIPWSITFLPDGDMLVTERPGRLRIIRDGVLLPDSVPGVPEVHAEGQGGLFDVLHIQNLPRTVYFIWLTRTQIPAARLRELCGPDSKMINYRVLRKSSSQCHKEGGTMVGSLRSTGMACSFSASENARHLPAVI